jgi:hypothetical protein
MASGVAAVLCCVFCCRLVVAESDFDSDVSGHKAVLQVGGLKARFWLLRRAGCCRCIGSHWQSKEALGACQGSRGDRCRVADCNSCLGLLSCTPSKCGGPMAITDRY